MLYNKLINEGLVEYVVEPIPLTVFMDDNSTHLSLMMLCGESYLELLSALISKVLKDHLFSKKLIYEFFNPNPGPGSIFSPGVGAGHGVAPVPSVSDDYTAETVLEKSLIVKLIPHLKYTEVVVEYNNKLTTYKIDVPINKPDDKILGFFSVHDQPYSFLAYNGMVVVESSNLPYFINNEHFSNILNFTMGDIDTSTNNEQSDIIIDYYPLYNISTIQRNLVPNEVVFLNVNFGELTFPDSDPK